MAISDGLEDISFSYCTIWYVPVQQVSKLGKVAQPYLVKTHAIGHWLNGIIFKFYGQ